MKMFLYPPTPLDKTGLSTLGEQQAQTALLTDIEADLVAISGYVDEIEANQATAQTSLDDITTNTSDTAINTVEINQKLAAALVHTAHDYISMTYVGSTTDIDTVTYKSGGASGTTVATLTMGYDGSNRLTTVTKT